MQGKYIFCVQFLKRIHLGMTGLKRNRLCSFFPCCSADETDSAARLTADILAKPNLHHTRYIITFLGSAAPSVASAHRLRVLYVCKYKQILTIQCHEICKQFLSHTHLNLLILCPIPISITTPRCQ